MTINLADSRETGRGDPLGVLLLLREQGRRGRCPDGADVRRHLLRQRRSHHGRTAHHRPASHRCDRRRCFDTWERHRHLFRAMLDARAVTARRCGSSGTRPGCRSSDSVAAMIRTERAAGTAPDGIDATALATVLLEINDRMLERLTFGGPLNRQQLAEARRRSGCTPSTASRQATTRNGSGRDLRRWRSSPGSPLQWLALHRRGRCVRHRSGSRPSS